MKYKLIYLLSISGIILLTSRFILQTNFIEQQQSFAEEIPKEHPSQTNTAILSQETPTPIRQNSPTSTATKQPKTASPILQNPLKSTAIQPFIPAPNSTFKKIEQQLQQTTNKEQYPLLSIPTINLNTLVVTVGYTSINGKRTWEVPANNVGTPENAILNNLILIGHTGAYTSVFQNLRNVRKGSIILYKKNEDSEEHYVVEENIVTNTNDLSSINAQEQQKATLITCEGEKRRIVKASKINE